MEGIITYDTLGRMTSKQAVTSANGTPQVTTTFSLPSFDATKVHAMAQAQTSSELFSSAAQTLTYTGFDKVRTLKQGNDSIRFTYGYDHQRIRMQELTPGTNSAKDYVGTCEFITEPVMGGTDTKSLTYLSDPYGVFAVVESHNGTDALHYALKDNLGSWVTITNENGQVEQQMSFDAWGTPYYSDSANLVQATSLFFDRGFTGHEHLVDFDLINMNGRIYDPFTSSFLSVDNYVQDPSYTQNFNRYAYCMNNPLKYTDPDGELWHIIAGIIIGGTINLINNWDNIDNFLEGFTTFAVGAGAGALTATNPFLGSVVGSAAINAHNEITNKTGQGEGFKNVNWGRVATEAGIGAGTGLISYGAGSFVNKLKIGNTPLAEKLLDVCGIKNLNARTLLGNTFNGTLAGTGAGLVTGLARGAFTGDWDVWNYTWRGAAYGGAGGLAYSAITTIGYQMQLKYGRQPSLDSDIIESTSVIADDAVNQFNNYETPVSEIGPIVLDEMTVVPQSTTSATVYMPEVYHPYLIAPKTYQYTSPTFYHLIHILQIPR